MGWPQASRRSFRIKSSTLPEQAQIPIRALFCFVLVTLCWPQISKKTRLAASCGLFGPRALTLSSRISLVATNTKRPPLAPDYVAASLVAVSTRTNAYVRHISCPTHTEDTVVSFKAACTAASPMSAFACSCQDLWDGSGPCRTIASRRWPHIERIGISCSSPCPRTPGSEAVCRASLTASSRCPSVYCRRPA